MTPVAFVPEKPTADRVATTSETVARHGRTFADVDRSALRSAWAHVVAHDIEFRAGDGSSTETSAPIWGYNAVRYEGR